MNHVQMPLVNIVIGSFPRDLVYLEVFFNYSRWNQYILVVLEALPAAGQGHYYTS